MAAKSIARLSFVSKHWSSIIRSKDFTNLYMARSLTRPRLLIVYNNTDALLLDSCSQEDQSSDHQRVSIPSHHPHDYMMTYNVSEPVRGLICHQSDMKVMIGNPSTSQFITLPKINTMRKNLFSLLGYDPVNDVYKVLCMTILQDAYKRRKSQAVSDMEHQVFTLGPKQKWRKIKCKQPHLPDPYTKNICIDGVAYYYIFIKGKGFLNCFDVTSEDFHVVKTPEDVKCLEIVNYGGKIALFTKKFGATLTVWVLKHPNKQEWSKVSHLVYSLANLVGTIPLRFEGTLSTGQLIFAPLWYMSNSPYFLIIYDLKEDNVKKVVIEVIGNYTFNICSSLDHVESPMVLSNVK